MAKRASSSQPGTPPSPSPRHPGRSPRSLGTLLLLGVSVVAARSGIDGILAFRHAPRLGVVSLRSHCAHAEISATVVIKYPMEDRKMPIRHLVLLSIPLILLPVVGLQVADWIGAALVAEMARELLKPLHHPDG